MKYTLGCEVSDKDNKKIIIISGYKFDDLITRFLNKLAQYENLNDYLETEELGNNDQWELQNVADRICNLAKVIELYKKIQNDKSRTCHTARHSKFSFLLKFKHLQSISA